MSVDDVVIRTAKCVGETPKAIKVKTAYGECWVPRSCISSRSEVFNEGDDGLLVISKYLIGKPGKEALRQR